MTPPLRIAIGSTRRPKVDAVKQTLARLAPAFGCRPEDMTFLTVDTASGVDETPRSLEDLMAGARNRARAMRHLLNQKGQTADLYIGLEGGLWEKERTVFLQSWAFVTDGTHESFGSSGVIPLPDAVAEEAFHRRRSLSDVIDAFANQENVRSNQGTWGVLTGDRLTRQESFELALLSALAPFYNHTLYRPRRPGRP
jgi:inosine/xanthosine triphosphatase